MGGGKHNTIRRHSAQNRVAANKFTGTSAHEGSFAQVLNPLEKKAAKTQKEPA